MKVERFVGGILESNGYVLYQKDGGDCYIIDPGYNSRVFVDFVDKHNLNLKGILLTHNHPDHVGAVRGLDDAHPCNIYMHIQDAAGYKGRVDVEIEDGYEFDLEGERIITLSTPGHTKGSVCFMCPESKICFTGDTIFDTDLGRTDLPGSSEQEMIDSICNVIDKWENDIHIYPGHDNGCSMKFVRQHNSEFNALLKGEAR